MTREALRRELPNPRLWRYAIHEPKTSREDRDEYRHPRRLHIPRALRQAVERGQLPDVDVEALAYFISHETVVASEKHPGMAGWREEIFALMQRNAEETASYFCVPARQVMEVGTEVEV